MRFYIRIIEYKEINITFFSYNFIYIAVNSAML